MPVLEQTQDIQAAGSAGLEEVERFALQLGVELDVREDGLPGEVELWWLGRGSSQRGDGSRVMRRLLEHADATGKSLVLSVLDGEAGLVDYYGRFGFVALDAFQMRREPNGLSVAQAFAAWFRCSQVVDQAGRPLRVYHGSRHRFTEFSTQRHGSRTDSGYLGAGFYFGDRWHAGMYAGMDRGPASRAVDDEEWRGAPFIPVGAHSALYPVYLSLQNPLRLQEVPDPQAPRRALDREKHIRDRLGLPRTASAQEVTAAARAAGHDGVIFEYSSLPSGSPWPLDREYVAFDPQQIKSAIGNRGSFDGEHPDIRFSEAAATPRPRERA